MYIVLLITTIVLTMLCKQITLASVVLQFSYLHFVRFQNLSEKKDLLKVVLFVRRRRRTNTANIEVIVTVYRNRVCFEETLIQHKQQITNHDERNKATHFVFLFCLFECNIFCLKKCHLYH